MPNNQLSVANQKLKAKELRQEILELVNRKLKYFLTFQETARIKKDYKQSEQYKTEKWLQAEIIFNLHNKHKGIYKIVPEFKPKNEKKRRQWDLLIETCDTNNKTGILLEMKCLSASKRNDDARVVIEDIEKVAKNYPDFKGYEKSYLLILPTKPNPYTTHILNSVKPFLENHKPKMKEKIISNKRKNGVLFIWMDFK